MSHEGGSLIIKVCRIPRGESVVVAVLLLCIGISLTLLSSPARGFQDLSAFGMNHVLPADQGTPVNAPSLDGSYSPFVLAEEANKDPVNAGLLTILFLAASFLGASVGEVLAASMSPTYPSWGCSGCKEILASAS
jgi:hypothetical protein